MDGRLFDHSVGSFFITGWMLTIVILMVIETIDLFPNRLSFFARVIDFLC